LYTCGLIIRALSMGLIICCRSARAFVCFVCHWNGLHSGTGYVIWKAGYKSLQVRYFQTSFWNRRFGFFP